MVSHPTGPRNLQPNLSLPSPLCDSHTHTHTANPTPVASTLKIFPFSCSKMLPLVLVTLIPTPKSGRSLPTCRKIRVWSIQVNYTQSRNPVLTALSQAPWEVNKNGQDPQLPPRYSLTPNSQTLQLKDKGGGTQQTLTKMH